MSDLFSSLKISGSGLSVFRRKMNVAAENLANAETTKTPEGGPYKKKVLEIGAKKVKDVFSRQLNAASVELKQTDSKHVPGRPVALLNTNNILHAQGSEYVNKDQEPRMVYDPDHPDANEEGFVAMPDIDPLVEMVEMMTAARAYEANLSAIKTVKEITKKALEI
jgi:flagellar basal-body rod protein FlgC